MTEVRGYVNDPFVNNRDATLVAWWYTDYTTMSSRADEAWNLTSILGTPLGDLGLLYDSHLQNGDDSFFYYFNASGPHCDVTPPILFPQYVFGEETYVGKTRYGGVEVYFFNASLPIGKNKDDFWFIEGYISVTDENPVAFKTVVSFSGFVIVSEQVLRNFRSLTGFDQRIFAVPGFCSTAPKKAPTVPFPFVQTLMSTRGSVYR